MENFLRPTTLYKEATGRWSDWCEKRAEEVEVN